MRPYHPSQGGADPGTEPTPEQAAKAGKTIAQRVQELLDELPKGRECPRCGASMIHYRLYGYRCPRCF